jgi:hypothetical protein
MICEQENFACRKIFHRSENDRVRKLRCAFDVEIRAICECALFLLSSTQNICFSGLLGHIYDTLYPYLGNFTDISGLLLFFKMSMMKKFCSYARPAAMTSLVFLFGMYTLLVSSVSIICIRHGSFHEVCVFDGEGPS